MRLIGRKSYKTQQHGTTLVHTHTHIHPKQTTIRKIQIVNTYDSTFTTNVIFHKFSAVHRGVGKNIIYNISCKCTPSTVSTATTNII